MRAKLCGCVREVLLNAGGTNGKKPDSGAGFVLALLGAMRVGFKVFCQMLLLYWWVF